jgi:FMN reductase (NADPH)
MPLSEKPDQSVIEVIKAHRSIRAFHDEPLEEGLLERLVEAGTRASTSANMQTYSVIAITDRELKKRLAELCADQTQIHQSAGFLVFCADLHKLTLTCRMHGSDDTAVGEAEALLVAVIDAALVMQNVAIAAESLGLGICMIGAMRNNPYEVAEALHLPKRVLTIAGFCIGWPAEAGEIKPRLPLDAALHRDRYRSDRELFELFEEYDEIQSTWYAERNMHPRDPRWTAVMSRRLPGMAKREAVGRFLRDQQLNTR